jgi:hypothetical protein
MSARDWSTCFGCAKVRETHEIIYTLRAQDFGCDGSDRHVCKQCVFKFRQEFLHEKAIYQWAKEDGNLRRKSDSLEGVIHFPKVAHG